MHKRAIAAGLLLALCLIPWTTLSAAPTPPLRVVNHQTKQCGEIFGGDECTDCFPPEGWESLGYTSEAPCPEGYTVVDRIDYTCQGFKIDRCCSEGHSGAAGACQDLVINDKKKQCAFVDDIQTCVLPERWTKKPDSTDLYDWTCPADYRWLESLTCEGQVSSSGQAEGKGLPCLGSALAGPAAIGLWLLLRDRH